jgi:hypothetical protein
MTLIRSVLSACALTVAPLSMALAQWPSEMVPGARVQVQVPERQYQFDVHRGQMLRGKVRAISADTLYLAVGDSIGPLAIPRRLIQHAYLSHGVPSAGESAIRRGLGGAIGGALVGWGIGALDDDIDNGDAALIGGAIGLGTGALFGALFPQERWKRMKWEPMVGIGPGSPIGVAFRGTF